MGRLLVAGLALFVLGLAALGNSLLTTVATICLVGAAVLGGGGLIGTFAHSGICLGTSVPAYPFVPHV
ncbi:hypothetical protein CJ014_17675 [Pleomorphomonas carboxyditropha]|uniref:Uncharacterized protein n=1 Tax=Pleomorphomonas carboxyditropha TaxID=2023338 RepID=A0A2G9WTF3_9HYPH|nr:hypothetical protein CJ014_17675 [Pleomorphomonas carboxyditropha]